MFIAFALEKIAVFLATGMYVGYAPFAPGTFGSIWGVVICFFLSSSGIITYGVVSLSILLIAVWASAIASKHFDKKDPREIVCDEIAGYIFAMFLIPFTALNAIIIFLLFRFFDIVKPFPIGLIDRRMSGGTGIVLDDVMAGIYANIAFRIIMKLAAA